MSSISETYNRAQYISELGDILSNAFSSQQVKWNMVIT